MRNSSCVFSRVTRFLLREEITHIFSITHAGLNQKVNFNYEVSEGKRQRYLKRVEN